MKEAGICPTLPRARSSSQFFEPTKQARRESPDTRDARLCGVLSHYVQLLRGWICASESRYRATTSGLHSSTFHMTPSLIPIQRQDRHALRDAEAAAVLTLVTLVPWLMVAPYCSRINQQDNILVMDRPAVLTLQ